METPEEAKARRDAANAALPHPTVKRILVEDDGQRLVECEEGKFWAQSFCTFHDEWETFPEPYASEQEGREAWREQIEADNLLRALMSLGN